MASDEGEPEDDGVAGTDSFRRALAALGESGGAFLVAGEVPPDVHDRLCDRWLGDPDLGRRRIVVRTRGVGGGTAPSCGSDRTRVVAFAADVRSVAATGADAPDRTAASLSALGRALFDAVDAADDGLEPGALRVCIESAAPLRAAYDDEAVFRFLHLVTTRVRAARGLVHVHLPADPDDEVVTLFAPLFDGTVALRGGGDAAQQRWHIRGSGVTSEWLPVG